MRGESGNTSGGIPDMRWINRNVPVLGLATALDLRVGSNGNLHCWHTEGHANGDRTASVGVRKRNNTVKCFGVGCGAGPFGPIDLIRDVLGLEFPAEAALWIAERFEVPRIPKGKHLARPRSIVRPFGFEGDIGLLIQSGLWADLSPATRCIAPVLLLFADKEPGKTSAGVRVSFRGISRYSGVRSPNAVSKALNELEEIGWLERNSQPMKARGDSTPVRATGTYLLTPQSDHLLELANTTAKQFRDEIEAERHLRKSQRAERRQLLESNSQNEGRSFTEYKSLYRTDSVGENDGIGGIAGNGPAALGPSPELARSG